jgi:hypothetical protein
MDIISFFQGFSPLIIVYALGLIVCAVVVFRILKIRKNKLEKMSGWSE